MRAYLVNQYKKPIEAGTVPDPEVGESDVLVEIHAAGVNRLDAKIRDGEFKTFLPYETPFVLGHDLAGIVTRVGPRVTRFSVGDEVYGRVRDHRIGTFAERISVDQADLAMKPERLSMEEAASVPLVALTAWQALVERAKVQSGQMVLIQAGSGGVGTYAVQLAKHLGATVAATTGTGNVELVRDLGADTVIDYKLQDFETIASDCDVVLDSLGGETLAKSLRILKTGGLAIGIAGPPDPAFAAQLGLALPLRLAMTALSLKTRYAARRLGVRYSFLFMEADGSQLEKIAGLIDRKILDPVIDRIYGFDETPEALAQVETGRSRGKVVVSMA